MTARTLPHYDERALFEALSETNDFLSESHEGSILYECPEENRDKPHAWHREDEPDCSYCRRIRANQAILGDGLSMREIIELLAAGQTEQDVLEEAAQVCLDRLAGKDVTP